MDKDDVALLAQKCFQTSPVVVLGSGASAPYNVPGMKPLQKHLLAEIKPDGDAEVAAWLLVRTALANGDHLEMALSGKTLPDSLVQKIVRETWICMCKADATLFQAVLEKTQTFPIGQLLNKFFESSTRAMHIVTTNYDRVVEYACVASGLNYYTGFLPAYMASREIGDNVQVFRNGRPERTVKLWKVHGSLDWFDGPDGESICAPIFGAIPPQLTPLIVTPGVSKFQRTYDEPFRSTIQGADSALADAKGFLCFGFGFRDVHIEPKIVSRCRKATVPIVVAARTLTAESKDFLQTKIKKDFLVLEKSGEGTVARTSENWDGVQLDQDYWSIEGFLRLVT